MSEFEIGTSEGTLTAIDLLTNPLPDPKSNYFPYSRKVNTGAAKEVGVGAPFATWTFPVMDVDQYNQLRTFEGDVVIRTKLDDDSFAMFEAYASFPLDPQNRWYSQRQNYTVTFRNLVLIPEGS
jgi:hypothetical protein